jgi:hypothetical protein
MARPAKTTIDYFPHQTKHGPTMFILERRWGNDGYAFWFKLLETLGTRPGMVLDCDNAGDWAYLLASTFVTDETANNILDQLADLGAIDASLWGRRVVFSQNLVDGVSDAFSRRIEQKPSLSGVSAYINPDKAKLLQAKTGKGKGKGKERNKYTEEDLSVAQKIHSGLLNEFTEYPAIKKADINKWADEVRKLRTIDGFTHDQILAVCKWGMSDTFWGENFKSVQGLRKPSGNNGLSKFENMMSSMNRTAKKDDKGFVFNPQLDGWC